MTQVFREDGSVVPVTLVKAGPCTIASVRANPAGKKAATIGFGTKKSVAKPQREDWKDLGSFAHAREFEVSDDTTLERGNILDVTVFAEGDMVNVVGTSKGRGFQGVVKRHGFHGSPATHGHKDQLRMPGSIGAGGPQRTFKGIRMGGHMGQQQVTVKNLEIVKIDLANHTLAIKGAIPGARGSLITISATDGNVWN